MGPVMVVLHKKRGDRDRLLMLDLRGEMVMDSLLLSLIL